MAEDDRLARNLSCELGWYTQSVVSGSIQDPCRYYFAVERIPDIRISYTITQKGERTLIKNDMARYLDLVEKQLE